MRYHTHVHTHTDTHRYTRMNLPDPLDKDEEIEDREGARAGEGAYIGTCSSERHIRGLGSRAKLKDVPRGRERASANFLCRDSIILLAICEPLRVYTQPRTAWLRWRISEPVHCCRGSICTRKEKESVGWWWWRAHVNIYIYTDVGSTRATGQLARGI